jgi:F-type H+-transporting ATPase subunit gamma
VQKPTVERLLPIVEAAAKKVSVPYIFEPSPEETLKVMLPMFLEVKLFNILLESRTAETGARLRAMSNATDNAEKLASDLTLEFFRARQDTITREILEVASGAESLKGK